MRALFLLSLIASVALAGPFDQTRGGNLKRRQYQTYATTTLYVDPTGSNSNACTASGTSACLTLAGAFAKLPRFINNNVTINVAAGTYAENLNIANGLYIANGVTLAVTGALATITPATGTNSGTTTAAALGSSAGPGNVTDGTQTWTVNDLKGRFILFGSGALSGQAYPIVSNTATNVVFSGTGTAVSGATYTIVSPSVIFAQPAGGTIANFDGRGTLAFTSIDVTSSATSGLIYRGPSAVVTFTHSRIVTSSSIAALNVQGGIVTLTRSYVYTSGTGNSFFASGSSYGQTPMIGGASFYARAAGAAAYYGVQYNVSTTTSPFVAEVTTGVGVKLAAPISSMATSGVWVTCSTAGSGTGVSVGVPATSGVGASSSVALMNGGSRVTGCSIGVAAYDDGRATVGAMAFDTVTTAFLTSKGGVIDFNATTPTFSTVTNELQQDGTNYTFATLTGLPAPQVISDTYGSRFIR